MKRQWSSDDLIEHFTVLPHERHVITPLRTDYTRLGFAVLLKCFLLDGRFPQYRMDVPTSVITRNPAHRADHQQPVAESGA